MALELSWRAGDRRARASVKMKKNVLSSSTIKTGQPPARVNRSRASNNQFAPTTKALQHFVLLSLR
eukprot:9478730-Pyramimonas_sp.AAC.1